jgi:hypothetical protein
VSTAEATAHAPDVLLPLRPPPQALLGLYGLVLLWIISILVCSYFNNPGAMSTFMFWLLITLPIFMILPVLYNLSLVGLNDACYSLESLVIGRVGDSGSTPRKLLDFYLFQQGAPNIRALLNTTGIVDLSQVEGQINSTKTKVVSEVRSRATVGGEEGQCCTSTGW